MQIYNPKLRLESYNIIEIDKKPWEIIERHSSDSFLMRDMRNHEEKVLHIDDVTEKVSNAERVVLR